MSIAIANYPLPQGYSLPVANGTANASASEAGASSTASDAVEADFLKFAQMSPEERVQQAVLSKLGMTEEEFNKLDAKAKGDVLTKVRDEMLRQMDAKGEHRTGALADIKV